MGSIGRLALGNPRRAPRAPRVAVLAAALAGLPLLCAPARAANFDDYAWLLDACATLEGGSLVLQLCGGCDTSVTAQMVAPLPGTLVFDLHFEVPIAAFPTLQISSHADASDYFASLDCPPCSGDLRTIAIDVAANDLVFFSLQQSGFTCGLGAVFCTFSNLQFVPAAGSKPLAGALDTSIRMVLDAGATTDANAIASLAALGDVDGDGRDDFAYGMPNKGLPFNAGAVRVLSGATGALLHELKGATQGARLGTSLGDAGDVDGDGAGDIVVEESLKARVFSGATGAELFALAPPNFIDHRVDGAGDVDGDGVPDIVVGSENADVPGKSDCGLVAVYSGATRAQLHRAEGDNANDGLGRTVSGAGDVNGDGFDDYLATSLAYPAPAHNGLVRVYSGATGAVLHSFVGTPAQYFGAEAHGAGDFDGDGRDDIVVGGGSVGPPAGFVRVYSGASGAVLFSLAGSQPFEYVGYDVAGAGDLDGDGHDDILASSIQPGLPQGRVRAFGGPAGVLLFDFAPLEYKNFALLLDGGSDFTADGTPDVILLARTLLEQQKLITVSGAPASHGAPLLSASGTLLPGSPLSVSLADGPPAGAAFLVLGAGGLYAPLKSGYLVPVPTWIVPALPLTRSGSLQLATKWPAGLFAPVAIVFQAWCPEPAAAQGFVASNGLMLAPP